jgi:hypothetical protein
VLGTRLNGWHRLWIVTVAVWTLLVAGLAYSTWPTAESVEPDDVYGRMPRSTKWILRDAGEPLFRPGRDIRPPSDSIIIDIDGHSVAFLAGAPDDSVTTTVNAYSAALHDVVRAKRVRYAQELFTWWAAAAVALYIAGWTVGWVRRGFTSVKPIAQSDSGNAAR